MILDPGPGSASKNLNIFNPKNCFQALGKMIWDVYPGSRGRKALNAGSGSASLIIAKGRVPLHEIPDPSWPQRSGFDWIQIQNTAL
jgi:hypothetical protein